MPPDHHGLGGNQKLVSGSHAITHREKVLRITTQDDGAEGQTCLGLVQSGLGCCSCGQAPVVDGIIDASRGTEAVSFQLTSRRSLDSSCFAQTPEERPCYEAPRASNGGIDEHICGTQEESTLCECITRL